MLGGTLVGLLSNEASIISVYVRRVAPTAGVPLLLIFGSVTYPNIVGTVVSEAVPSTSAAVWSWYTALASGRGRGRTYIPGIPESHQDGGYLTGAAMTIHNAAILDWYTDPWVPTTSGTGEWELVVWSRLNLSAQDITWGVAHTNLGTIRNRRQVAGPAA